MEQVCESLPEKVAVEWWATLPMEQDVRWLVA
jgi:hypothetical protein